MNSQFNYIITLFGILIIASCTNIKNLSFEEVCSENGLLVNDGTFYYFVPIKADTASIKKSCTDIEILKKTMKKRKKFAYMIAVDNIENINKQHFVRLDGGDYLDSVYPISLKYKVNNLYPIYTNDKPIDYDEVSIMFTVSFSILLKYKVADLEIIEVNYLQLN